MCSSDGYDNRLTIIQAICCGDLAAEVLAIDQGVSVLGSTTRGVFLESASRWLVFLSYERFHSPLTVNLPETPISLRELKPKLEGKVSSGMLKIEDIKLAIATQNSQLWRPLSPEVAALPKLERVAKLTRCAGFVLGEKPDAGFSQVLAAIFNLHDGQYAGDGGNSLPNIDVPGVQSSVNRQDPEMFLELVTNLLGAGQGLTPSGDDFLIGLLLALNRWKEALWPAANLKELNLQLVENAYRVTTRLSANLIELAADGKGDERLINVVDLLMSDTPIETKAVLDLLGWGSSSGVDAFVGMAVALTA